LRIGATVKAALAEVTRPTLKIALKINLIVIHIPPGSGKSA
jgi:hypothetical protein